MIFYSGYSKMSTTEQDGLLYIDRRFTMRERIRKFIALVMTVLVLNQLPGFDTLVTHAATNELYTNLTLTSDSEYTHVFRSGGVSLTVDSEVTVAGVELATEGSVNTVNNNGTVNNVTVTSGELNLNGGYYGSIYVAEGAGGGVIGNSITAGTISADGPIHLEGTNTVASLTTANDLAGTGTVTVTGELSIPGTSTTINVNKDTIINAPYGDLTVYCDGTAYTFVGGTTGGSVLEDYGVYVTFQTDELNLDWVPYDDSSKINTYMWYGESTGKYILTANEGYHFPDDYATKIDISGSGSNTFDYISETEVHFSYTVYEYDPNEVVITFPALEEDLKPGTGTLTVADTYYGVAVTPSVSSDTNITSGVTVEYKVAGADDSSYTKTAPTAVGSYTARVTLPENDEYEAITLTDDFSISYLPAPESPYTLSGTAGGNNYYTSAVTVIAREGYAISQTMDGEYVGQFTISNSKAQSYVYFMDENTGAKTAGILMAAINIDTMAPTIDVEGDNTYYADSLAVAISDANLSSVTVNGEAVTIDSRTEVLALKSNGGVEEYEIVVTDLAGHTRVVKVTVAAEWTKTGEIPSGSMVKLQAGQNYTLGSGTWTVSGDSTSYAGGSTFYVGGEGQYTFNQQ